MANSRRRTRSPARGFPEAGTLAAPGRLDAWELPAGTTFKQGAWGLQFTTPKGTAAHALAAHRGVTIDQVIEAGARASPRS